MLVVDCAVIKAVLGGSYDFASGIGHTAGERNGIIRECRIIDFGVSFQRGASRDTIRLCRHHGIGSVAADLSDGTTAAEVCPAIGVLQLHICLDLKVTEEVNQLHFGIAREHF